MLNSALNRLFAQVHRAFVGVRAHNGFIKSIFSELALLITTFVGTGSPARAYAAISVKPGTWTYLPTGRLT